MCYQACRHRHLWHPLLQSPQMSREWPYLRLCLRLLRWGNVSPAPAQSKCLQHGGIQDMLLGIKKTANPFIIFF